MAIPFRERNPVPIGAAGLLVIALLLVLAFNIQSIPFIGGGDHYRAAFSEAGGLLKGDDVRIAGVKVGKVDAVDLAGDHVVVDFKVTEPAAFGTTTGASVRMKTLLGQKYLALEPGGPGQLKEGSEIPLDRTVSSYDIVNAFSDLATTTERIDTGQLAKSLTTLATEFKDSPQDVRAALDGLSRLSRTIASRDAELKRLLASANSVSGTVAQRNKAVESIIKDADLLLVELDKRREDIHTLFVNTSRMAQQITGLVRDNRAELKPALDQLTKVLAVLQKHEQDLNDTIAAMAPFTRLFANVLGNGRWFDTYIQNLTTPVDLGGN
ncbi:MCE family protein [Pedococcus ginsenosidimutans]|jgi:phospholipid/cholesterol/gamma-HCH transport system substrate-binding protein|uniref:MCE family protein n=1 Tax=Pedococcus ginsenosidimutans TaxID=490570 RepID=A0ABP8XIC3_9MICO